MNKLHIDLGDIIQELQLGGFHAATENDKTFFNEVENCLVANIRRGAFHYLVVWDYTECEIQIYEVDPKKRGDEDHPNVWSINTVTGVVTEL